MAERAASVPYSNVPTVESSGGGGTPSGVRANPNEFGAQVSGATEDAGKQGFDIAQKFQEQANHTAVNDKIVNGYVPEVNNLVSSYKKLSGMDAVAAQPEYEKQLQSINNKYLNDGNPTQKEFMGQFVQRHSIYTMSDISNHADSQYTQHENVVNTQSLQNTQDEAANNWQNPEAVDFNVTRAKGLSTIDYGNKIGHDAASQPIVNQMSNEAASKVATTAIKMAIDNGDYTAARNYKNKYDNILSGKDKLDIEKNISSLNVADNAKNYVDNLFTGSPAIRPDTAHYQDVQTKATIADLAQKNNFDPNIAFALRATESGGGISSNSSRKDAFQTDTKLRDKGFEGDDLAASAHNGFKIWNMNTADLKTRLGRDITPSEGYLAYNQGGAGATALLNAAPTDTAVQALSKIMPVADAQEHVQKNGGTATMSAGDFSSHVQQMFQNHYDTQKVNNASPDAIRSQANIQLPAIQLASNPHDLFNQMSDRLPAAQAAVDSIPDDKVREASQKQLKLKYEQAKLGDTAWKNQQAVIGQKYADDPRYTSMDEIPTTIKSDLRASGQLTAVEKSFNDKNLPKKDNTYGDSFTQTLDRLSTDDKTDSISDLATLQKAYGDTPGLHSSGFKQLQSLLKNSDTPEGKATIAKQSQFLNDLRQKMVAGESDADGKKKFEAALPLFFSRYNAAVAEKQDPSDLLSFDPKNKGSFAMQIGLPSSAELTSKKIQSSVSTISKIFGGNRPSDLSLTKEERVMADFADNKITEEEKNAQLKGLGVTPSMHAPRPE